MGPAITARRGGALCATVALGAVALLLWTPQADADVEFCPLGQGAGQCSQPEGFGSVRGLALDFENGRLYVADRGNHRVNVFEEDGDFLFAFGWGVDTGAAALETCTEASGCQAGLAGSGAGQLDKPVKVAVDNDPASPNHHFIYVSEDGAARRVQLFKPTVLPVEFIRSVGGPGSGEGQFASTPSVGVGPAGVLYALDNLAGKHRLQRWDASGTPIPPQCLLFEGGTARSLAVDTTGDFWVANEPPNQGVRKYDGASCALLFLAEESDTFENTDVAVEEAGDPFVTQREVRDKVLSSFRVIAAFEQSTGALERRFAYGRLPFGRPEGLAPRSGGIGGIFVSVNQPGFFLKRLDFTGTPPTLPDPGPIPAPPSLEVKELGSTRAKLAAEVNPEGKATEAHIEYLTQAEWEAQGESFDGEATKETEPKVLALGDEGFKLKAIEETTIGCANPASEAELPDSPCLVPETTYRWRVVATNADNPEGKGESSAESTFKASEATVIGEIWATRVGVDTARLHAEVNPTAIPSTGFFEYVDDAAFQEDVGEGGDGFAAAAKAPAGAPLDFGSGEGFVTRQATVFPLQPGTVYHYRLVAENPLLIEPKTSDPEEIRTFQPPEVDPSCPNEDSRIGLGAFLPDCRAYEMVSPLDKEGGDVRVGETTLAQPAVLEQASSSGEKLAYGSSRSFGGAESAPFTSQYVAERVPGVKWETHPINPPRGRPILVAIQQLNTEFKAFSSDLCDAWIVSSGEFPPPTPPGYLPGFSNLLRRTDELCAGAGFQALAPLAAPEGPPPALPFVMELQGVSADGGHAVFVPADKLLPEGSEGQRQLYEHTEGEGLRLVCRLPDEEVVSGSCTAGSSLGANDPGAQIGRVSEDGEEIFWSTPGNGEGKLYLRIGGTQTVAVSQKGEEESGTAKSWFWGAAADGSEAIFSTGDLNQGKADLYRFAPAGIPTTTPIAEGVLGVAGISEDAERVYFASKEVLGGEEANSEGDKAQAGKANLYLHEAGGGIEFVATPANDDLLAAVANAAYRRHTARVSPDGAHATFVSEAPLSGYDNKSALNGAPTGQVYRYDATSEELACVSCNPSGARPAGSSRIPPWQTGMHAARVLSDDGGRLYFESADALAARDSNGVRDVYQWEAPGTGGCDETDASFSPANEGCVDLVSSGQSPHDSRFVESSPNGNDVFFAGGASLLPQDPGVFDVYDARAGGGLPVPPPTPPICEGDTCAIQVPPPEEPSPASEGYTAPPEAAPPATKPAKKRRCAKGKRRVTRKGKSRCVAKRTHRRAR